MYYYVYSDELYHHGIKGQKWGVRRYQNEDGSVTSAGAKRYYDSAVNYSTSRLDRKAARARDMASRNSEARKAAGDSKVGKIYAVNEKYYNKRAKRLEERSEGLKSGKGSLNPILNKMHGRKINASEEVRVARGKELRDQGRTKAGAIGRYLARGIITHVGITAVSSIAARKLSERGQQRAAKAITAAAWAVNISSIVRTYQDIADMNAYDKTKKKK